MTAMGSWMFRVDLISWISITSANCLFLLLPQGPSIILKSFSETCWWSFSMVYFNRCDFHTVFNSNENSLFCFTNVIIIIPCIRACPKIKNYTNFMFKLSFASDVEIWTKCITSKRKFQLYFTVIFLQFFWLNNLFFFFFSLEWYYNKTIFVMFFNNCLVIGCCGCIFIWENTTLHWI